MDSETSCDFCGNDDLTLDAGVYTCSMCGGEKSARSRDEVRRDG